jgi:MFS family permease
MDWIALAFVIGFLGVIGLVTGALAKRKGYKFLPWFFAGGIIGLLVLAFLPDANDPKLSEIEQRTQARKGNDIGRNIAIFALALALVRLFASS